MSQLPPIEIDERLDRELDQTVRATGLKKSDLVRLLFDYLPDIRRRLARPTHSDIVAAFKDVPPRLKRLKKVVASRYEDAD